MCGCEHHRDLNAPCTCECLGHAGIRDEMARTAARAAEVAEVDRLRAERNELAAAVDRIRRRHPRGDEESSDHVLAPGLWCPTCGRERTENGYGACPDRQALTAPAPRPSTDPTGEDAMTEALEHHLTEYGTTNCPVERVRADVDEGVCSACGASVTEAPR